MSLGLLGLLLLQRLLPGLFLPSLLGRLRGLGSIESVIADSILHSIRSGLELEVGKHVGQIGRGDVGAVARLVVAGRSSGSPAPPGRPEGFQLGQDTFEDAENVGMVGVALLDFFVLGVLGGAAEEVEALLPQCDDVTEDVEGRLGHVFGVGIVGDALG